MTNKLKFSNYFLSTFLQIIAPTLLSLVRVQLFFGDGQACEGKLQGGSVAEDQLGGDVQIDAVVVPVRVVERARRHVEEVLRSEATRVQRGHGVAALHLLQRHSGGFRTFVAMTLTVNVNHVAMTHNASRTASGVVAHIHKYIEGRHRLALERRRHKPVKSPCPRIPNTLARHGE